MAVVGEDEGEAQRERTRLCTQLVEGEVAYNAVLSAFVKRVVRPVVSSPSEHGVQEADSQAVFAHVEELCTLSNLLVTLLKGRPSQWEQGQPARVGDVLSRIHQHASVFGLFVANLASALAIAHRIAPTLEGLVEAEVRPLLPPLLSESSPLVVPLVLCLPVHHLSDLHARVEAIAVLTPSSHPDHNACARVRGSLSSLLSTVTSPLLPLSRATVSQLAAPVFHLPSPPRVRACAVVSAQDGRPVVLVFTRDKLLALRAKDTPALPFLPMSSLAPLLALRLASCKGSAPSQPPPSGASAPLQPSLSIADLVTGSQHVFRTATLEDARWLEAEIAREGALERNGKGCWQGDVWCVRVWLDEVAREGGAQWLEVRQPEQDGGDEEGHGVEDSGAMGKGKGKEEGMCAKGENVQEGERDGNEQDAGKEAKPDQQAHNNKQSPTNGRALENGDEGWMEDGDAGEFVTPEKPKRPAGVGDEGRRMLSPAVSENIRELFNEFGDALAEELDPFLLSPSQQPLPVPHPPPSPPAPSLPSLKTRHPLARARRGSSFGAVPANGAPPEEEEGVGEERPVLTPVQALSLCEVHVVGSQDTCVEGSAKKVVHYILRIALTTRGTPFVQHNGSAHELSSSATVFKRFSHFHALHAALKGMGLSERLPDAPAKAIKKSGALVRERRVSLNSYIREIVLLFSAFRRDGGGPQRQQAALAVIRFLGLDVFLQVVQLSGMESVRPPQLFSTTVHLPSFEVEVDVEGVTCGDMCMEVLERQQLADMSWKYSLFAEVEGEPGYHILDHSLRVVDVPLALSSKKAIKWKNVKCFCFKVVPSPAFEPRQHICPDSNVPGATPEHPSALHDLVFEFKQAVFFVSVGALPVDTRPTLVLAALYLRFLLTSHGNSPTPAKGALAASSVQLASVTTQQVSNYLNRLLPSKFALGSNEAIAGIKAEVASTQGVEPQAVPATYLATLAACNVLSYGCVMFYAVTICSVNGSTAIPSLLSKRDSKAAKGNDAWLERDTSGLGCGTAKVPLLLPHTGTLGIRLDNILLFGENTQQLLQRFPMRRVEDSLCNHNEVTLYGSSLRIVLRTPDAHRLSCCVENFLEIRRHFVV